MPDQVAAGSRPIDVLVQERKSSAYGGWIGFAACPSGRGLRVRSSAGWVGGSVSSCAMAPPGALRLRRLLRGRAVSEGFGLAALEAPGLRCVVFSRPQPMPWLNSSSLPARPSDRFAGTLEADLERIEAAWPTQPPWLPQPAAV